MMMTESTRIHCVHESFRGEVKQMLTNLGFWFEFGSLDEAIVEARSLTRHEQHYRNIVSTSNIRELVTTGEGIMPKCLMDICVKYAGLSDALTKPMYDEALASVKSCVFDLFELIDDDLSLTCGGIYERITTKLSLSLKPSLAFGSSYRRIMCLQYVMACGDHTSRYIEGSVRLAQLSEFIPSESENEVQEEKLERDHPRDTDDYDDNQHKRTKTS